MPDVGAQTRIRPLDELDIGGIVRIDERMTGIYRPEVWERRVGYYLRRDRGASQVAEVDGRLGMTPRGGWSGVARSPETLAKSPETRLTRSGPIG